eukprot:Lithocolla_globosa_v1_NODE_7384_length_953_cov_8.576837.p1 type:complete len:282 gc:universal NODE_7384_length_953_cov_8.576837:846-1(-)
MGFPSEGNEAMYRNPITEVVRFLNMFHPESYRVYNFCSERSYDTDRFDKRVRSFPFDDHNAPPFEMIGQFCEDASNFLKEKEDNVCVTHCKAGKGRTGVMICCYLVYSSAMPDSEEALRFYGLKRTKNGKGVTIPSQQRYVHYYGRYLKEQSAYDPPTLLFNKLVMKPVPRFKNQIHFSIRNHKGDELYTSEFFKEKQDGESDSVEWVAETRPQLQGDIRVMFFHQKKTPKLLCQFWFNTFFENEVIKLQRPQIDKAVKDHKHKYFDDDFTIEMILVSASA